MLEKRDLDIIQAYFEDHSSLEGGRAEAVVFPESEGEIPEFLGQANEKRTPITISGAGTGVCGGRIPFGGVVVSLERMDKILKIVKDASGEKGYVVVQPGITIGDFKKLVEREALIYPPAPTEESALLGGTIATNASGARSYKYGPTRKWVRRLKVVLADGMVLDIRRGEIISGDNREFDITLPGNKKIHFIGPRYKMPKIKNAAGLYAEDGMDLIDLFIGQEGILGVIVEIEVGLTGKPENIFSCFAFFGAETDSWGFLKDVKKSSDIDIISLEYFDHNSLEILRAKYPKIPENSQAAVFFEQEVGGVNEEELLEKWQEMLERHNASIDEAWAEIGTDKYGFKDIRHDLPEIINEIVKQNKQPKVATDIAVPEARSSEMMNFYVSSLRDSGIAHAIFGHIGENHLHVNLLPKTKEELGRAREISLGFIKRAVGLGGTVSAEHGIGKIKHRYLEELYGRDGLKEMARVKKALDPNCILGRGNIFPQELL